MPTFQCKICGWSKDLPEKIKDWPKNKNGTTDLYPVCRAGKLHTEVNGYVCARCLSDANESRLNLKALLSEMKVSLHAVERFVERQEGDRITRDAARLAIIRMFDQARPIRFREKFMLQRYVNNGQPADYRYLNGWILVATVEKPQTVMTVERSWERKLGFDFWYVDDD
jgi:hypothetical protein